MDSGGSGISKQTTSPAFAKLAATLLCGIAGWAHGQVSARLPVAAAQIASSPADTLLQEMTQSAAIIFAGQVISIRRPAQPSEMAAGTRVEIVFRIDQAVRGCSPGSLYTLHEWSGLWPYGTQRYRPGQRLLMFLRSADADGLSSPVHGAEGAIPLRGGGAAPGPNDANPAAADWLVDLRWVEAQASRNPHSLRKPTRIPTHPLAGPTEISETDIDDEPVTFLRDAILPWMVAPRPPMAEMAPLWQVLDQCRGWTRQLDESR